VLKSTPDVMSVQQLKKFKKVSLPTQPLFFCVKQAYDATHAK